MQPETANYLIRGVPPFFFAVNGYISTCRLGSPIFRHIASSFSAAAATSQGGTGENKNSQDTNAQFAQLLAQEPRAGPEEDGERKGWRGEQRGIAWSRQ